MSIFITSLLQQRQQNTYTIILALWDCILKCISIITPMNLRLTINDLSERKGCLMCTILASINRNNCHLSLLMSHLTGSYIHVPQRKEYIKKWICFVFCFAKFLLNTIIKYSTSCGNWQAMMKLIQWSFNNEIDVKYRCQDYMVKWVHVCACKICSTTTDPLFIQLCSTHHTTAYHWVGGTIARKIEVEYMAKHHENNWCR